MSTSTLRVHHEEEVGTVLVVERYQRARRQYPCDACITGGPIDKGEVYRYVWSMLEGDSLTQRFHAGCV